MKFPFSSPFSHLTKKIGIDLGTSRVRIWTDQDGYLLDEPACVAVDTTQSKVLAVGNEAEEMIGRVQSHIEIFHPIQSSVIMNADITTAMLRVFLQKVFHSPYFFRPTIMMSLSSATTEVEKTAVTDMLYFLGAREVYFIDQVLAAAIGSGVPIADASGSFLLQLGAGIVECGIISLGSLVSIESTQYAGAYLDKSIQQVLRKEKLINVGSKTAEQIKQNLCSLIESKHTEMRVSGQDVIDGVPKEVTVESQLFQTALGEVAERYVQLVRTLFEKIPAELTADVIDKGVLLSGGLSQMDGLDTLLSSVLGVPVSVVEQPNRTVIKGIAQVLRNLDLFKESIGYKV